MEQQAWRSADNLPTWVFDWGSITWLVSPSSVTGASSTLGEVIINPGQGHDRHTHPEADEVLYIVEGTGVQTVGGGPEFPVSAGDAVWIPKGTEHSTFNTSWRPLRIVATYTPGGSEEGLRADPSLIELPARQVPRWQPINPDSF